jgi:succinylglutamic semialdehyde dehydrogenase
MKPGVWINGAWKAGEGEALISTDPAHGRTVFEAASASASQVRDALSAARRAFEDWSVRSFVERLAIVERFGTEVEARKDALAEAISRETGKLLWETQAEVSAVVAKIAISRAAFEERTGDKLSNTAFGHAALTHRPHGVMAVFGPYNFPAHLPNGHIVPALLAGNTVVLKPSELAPLTSHLICEAWERAGLPAGVINLVQGARPVGQALLEGEIDGLLFTGSMETGTFFHQHFAGRPDVILALEMGGNNPLIVWDVEDGEAAANLVIHSAFVTSGQRCTCARRLIVPQGKAGDVLIDALIAQTQAMRIGAWDDAEEAFIGPVVSARAASLVIEASENMNNRGGKPLLKPIQGGRSDAFVTPGIVEMTEARGYPDKETFGPLLQVSRAVAFDAAIQSANNTRFGLAAGLISDDAALWEQARKRLRAGIVNFNRPTTGAASSLPFGGPGLSGNHRPSAYYAADYCAWPFASQIAPKVEAIGHNGLPK